MAAPNPKAAFASISISPPNPRGGHFQVAKPTALTQPIFNFPISIFYLSIRHVLRIHPNPHRILAVFHRNQFRVSVPRKRLQRRHDVQLILARRKQRIHHLHRHLDVYFRPMPRAGLPARLFLLPPLFLPPALSPHMYSQIPPPLPPPPT